MNVLNAVAPTPEQLKQFLGTVEDKWDTVAIVEYPSKEAFVEIATSPEVQGFGAHRSAGLAGQLLIATSQAGTL